jgi:hypothetical protein
MAPDLTRNKKLDQARRMRKRGEAVDEIIGRHLVAIPGNGAPIRCGKDGPD